jgi:hypothetical protein
MEDKANIEKKDETRAQGSKDKSKLFEKFVNGLSYYLKNLTRLIWIIARFIVFISGICLVTSPFIIFAMTFIAPDTAVKAVKALADILETLVEVLK